MFLKAQGNHKISKYNKKPINSYLLMMLGVLANIETES